MNTKIAIAAVLLAGTTLALPATGWSQSAEHEEHHPGGEATSSMTGSADTPSASAGSQMPAGMPGMMGPGMMNPEMMRGMMGGGMMGSGMTQGMLMGPCPMLLAMRGHDLTADEVHKILEGMIAWFGHRRLEVGEVTEADAGALIADIQTVDGSLVERVRVDRRTGRMTFAE